ncbi:hypothetical protein BD309DRAFT_664226 [Dichomitus squalens]|nr:hypothetical protein BD309DRAFT_708738 [Dichomitus squalens]TBU37028.1 hypothetical protein BD309DRAFT_664226 [Dichomitus squalens]
MGKREGNVFPPATNPIGKEYTDNVTTSLLLEGYGSSPQKVRGGASGSVPARSTILCAGGDELRVAASPTNAGRHPFFAERWSRKEIKSILARTGRRTLYYHTFTLVSASDLTEGIRPSRIDQRSVSADVSLCDSKVVMTVHIAGRVLPVTGQLTHFAWPWGRPSNTVSVRCACPQILFKPRHIELPGRRCR